MGASMDMAEIVRVIKRWRWIVLLVPLLCLMTATISVFYLIPATYEASTTILVGRNLSSDQQASMRYEDITMSQQLVKTYGEIVKSWTISDEVIRDLSLSLTVEQFKKKIEVKLVSGTQVIKLSIFDQNPALAQQIANSTAKVFAQRVPELMKLNNVSILDPARLPVIPAKPRKALVIAVAGIAGSMVSLAFALTADYMDSRIRSKSEAEKILDLPVLGTIPKANPVTALSVRTSFLPLVDDPRSPESEAYRKLRTNVLFYCNRKGAQVLAVTSAQPAEGKTTVATNLAIGMAQMGKKVILVDADLRRPALYRVLGLSNDTGLSDLLMGTSEIPEQQLMESPFKGLSLMPSGPIPSNPSELLGSPRFSDILQYLRSISDIVMVDTPPITAVTDAVIISSMTDGVLLVTSGTKESAAVQAKNALKQVNATIMGVILNRVTPEANQYYDYYRA